MIDVRSALARWVMPCAVVACSCSERGRPTDAPSAIATGVQPAAAWSAGMSDARDSASSRDGGVPPVPSSPADSSGAVQRLTPLHDAKWLEALPLPPGHTAFVSVPLGATTPRPVVVGVHGAGDRAEWACGGYRAAMEAYPFIVCPQGVPDRTGQKFATAPPARLLADIDLALRALVERFGPYVAEGPVLYAGFSLGAIHGAKVVSQRARQFPVALMVEGGYTQWSQGLADEFARGGGRRVALVCGQSACPSLFAPAKRTLDRAGAECRLFDTRTGRHNLDGEMMQELKAVIRWLVADDARWAPFAG